jgi:hypothetical protein
MSRYAYPDDWKRYPAEEKPSTSEFRRRYAARRNRSLS